MGLVARRRQRVHPDRQHVRFINQGSGQYLATDTYNGTQFLKTVGDYSPNCDWVLEKA